MNLDLSSFKKAVLSLEQTVKIGDKAVSAKFTDDLRNVIRAGIVQNFEFTYELCWKFMKRYLENQIGSMSVDGISRVELFRLAAEHKLIDDVGKWKNYHNYRNLTSHTYDENVATEIADVAKEFVFEAKQLLSALEKRNDRS